MEDKVMSRTVNFQANQVETQKTNDYFTKITAVQLFKVNVETASDCTIKIKLYLKF